MLVGGGGRVKRPADDFPSFITEEVADLWRQGRVFQNNLCRLGAKSLKFLRRKESMLRDHIKGCRCTKAGSILGDAKVSVTPSTIVLSTRLLCLIVSVLHWTKLGQSYLNQLDRCYRLNAAGQKINVFYKYA